VSVQPVSENRIAPWKCRPLNKIKLPRGPGNNLSSCSGHGSGKTAYQPLDTCLAFSCSISIILAPLMDLWLKATGSTLKWQRWASVCQKITTFCSDFFFLHATAECLARLSYGLVVRLSVRLSHSGAASKRCKLGSRNFYRGLPQKLIFCNKILCL